MRRWLKRIIITLVIVSIPVAAFWFYAAWQGERELRAAIAELDESGEPWRLEDLLAARPKLAGQDDVRELIASVCGQTANPLKKTLIKTGWDPVPPNVLMSEHDLEIYREEIPAAEIALADARKLADIPNARVQLPWPSDLSLPNFDDLSKATVIRELLRCSAYWHSQLGDLDTAIKDCLAMQRLTQALQNELPLTAQLVRIALQAHSVNTAERVLAQGQPTAQQLERLQMAWEQFDTRHALRQGFVGERAIYHRYFEHLETGQTRWAELAGRKDGGSVGERVSDWSLRVNVKAAHAWTLRYMSDVVRTADLPESERGAHWNELEKEMRTAPGIERMFAVSAMKRFFEAHRCGDARIRCTIAGLAAERYRRDHDRWPHELAESCPKYLAKIPDDPYTGRPLQLRVTNDGIVIYSVGPDGQFSGNYQELHVADQHVLPYEFRLWNVPQRRQLVAAKP